MPDPGARRTGELGTELGRPRRELDGLLLRRDRIFNLFAAFKVSREQEVVPEVSGAGAAAESAPLRGGPLPGSRPEQYPLGEMAACD